MTVLRKLRYSKTETRTHHDSIDLLGKVKYLLRLVATMKDKLISYIMKSKLILKNETLI